MDKLILKSTTLLAGILISAPMIITTASAATTGGDYTSSANLTLQAGTGPVDPLDPTDPTNQEMIGMEIHLRLHQHHKSDFDKRRE